MIRVRPGRTASMIGAVFGVVMLLSVLGSGVLSGAGGFGSFFILAVLAIIGLNLANAFGKKGVPTYEIESDSPLPGVPDFGTALLAADEAPQGDFEGKIRKLESLRRDGLLTQEEFDREKKQILDELR